MTGGKRKRPSISLREASYSPTRGHGPCGPRTPRREGTPEGRILGGVGGGGRKSPGGNSRKTPSQKLAQLLSPPAADLQGNPGVLLCSGRRWPGADGGNEGTTAPPGRPQRHQHKVFAWNEATAAVLRVRASSVQDTSTVVPSAPLLRPSSGPPPAGPGTGPLGFSLALASMLRAQPPAERRGCPGTIHMSIWTQCQAAQDPGFSGHRPSHGVHF